MDVWIHFPLFPAIRCLGNEPSPLMVMTMKHIWFSAAIALGILVSACSRGDHSPVQPVQPPGTSSSSPSPVNPPDSVSANNLSDCGPARDVLSSCAYENNCGEEMALFLPAAARDVLVSLEAKGGFNREAFNLYCEQACRKKSPEVDFNTFAKDVCFRTAVAPLTKVSASSLSTLTFSVGGLVLGMAPVNVEKVKASLGEPLRTEPSPYECDSAYESEDAQLLTFQGGTFESDGKTAVLRSLNEGASVQIQLDDLYSWSEITMERLQTLAGIERLSIDASTLRLAPGVGASLETGWDFRFKNDRMVSVSHWIGC